MYSGIRGESSTSSTVEIPREKPGTIELNYLNPRNINIPRYYRLVSTDTNCPHDMRVNGRPTLSGFPLSIHTFSRVVVELRVYYCEKLRPVVLQLLVYYYEKLFVRSSTTTWSTFLTMSVVVCPLYGRLGEFPIPSTTDDGWGGWSTHTIRCG